MIQITFTNCAIAALLLLQTYVAGYFFSNQIEWGARYSLSDRIKSFLFSLAIALFGIALLVLAVVAWVLLWIYRMTWEKLYITFFIKYVWGNEQLPHDKEKNAAVHALALKMKKNLKWYQFSNKSYIWIDGWIQRNFEEK
jgi:hypothetical protein